MQNQIDWYYNPPKEVEALPLNLIDYFDYFLESKQNEITIGTIKKYKVSINLLKRFEQETKQKLNIIDINERFKIDFEAYCIKNNYAPNTISKDFRTYKTICNHAKHNGIEVSHQLERIKSISHKVDNIYLTFDDLNKIESTHYNESLSNVRDWLVISCYTAQRLSDLMRFNSKMIRIEKNIRLLEFTQQKTGKIMTIPLHPKVISILEKRSNEFPKALSHQNYNDYVKEVCKIAGINEVVKGSKKLENNNLSTKNKKQYRKVAGTFEKWDLVSSHVGRRSFATNFYGTIETSKLINVTGHSTESMFLSYIGKSNKDIALELGNIFNNL